MVRHEASGPEGEPKAPGAALPRRHRRLRYLVPALALILLLGALAGLKATQIGMLIDFGRQAEAAGPPPEVVSTAHAEQQVWEGTLSAVASVVSAKGVALSNDAAGVVSRLFFESGASVRRGQVLVELDSRVERAELKAARARRDLAQLSLVRSRALVEAGSLSRAQLDADETSFESLNAEASALEAQIGRKTVRAPFAGRLGIREVNLGQYLAPGTTIAVLESVESTFVDFTLPQEDLSVLSVGMPVRATLPDDSKQQAFTGAIRALDPAVDPATRAVRVRASLPDANGRLRPGMFVQVEVVLPKKQDVVAIPLTAVLHASYGDSVFCVDERSDGGGQSTKIARQQFVRLGEARGDFVSVLGGVKFGEEVVTSGAFKLRTGIPLLIDNESVKLEPKLDPRPQNR